MILVPCLAALLLAPFGPSCLQSSDTPREPKARGAQGEKEGKALLVQLPEGYVRYARLPEGGRLPRIASGPGGPALLFFKGEPSGGDLYFTRTRDEGKTFTPPQRLNETPGSVPALDGVHSGGIAIGPDGRATMAWISGEEKPRLFLVKETAEGGLGAIQDLGAPEGLCATPGVAVDAQWTYLFYALRAPDEEAESRTKGRIWFRRSSDGIQFSEPVTVDRETDGISERSMIAAHVDLVKGTVYALYRSGYELRPGQPGMARGMRLLASSDRGQTFQSSSADNHKQQRDPVSRCELSQESDTTLACWGGGGLVCWTLIRRDLKKTNLPVDPHDERDVLRSQPTAVASETEILMAWLEQSKEDRSAPRRIAWKIWRREGRLPQGEGFCPELPGDSVPVAIPRSEGGFTILY